MKTLSWKIFLVLPILIISCQSQKNNDELYDEVMKIHDEVMPKMNDMHKLKLALKNEMDSTSDLTEARKAEIETAILKLDSASEGMMGWMRQFDPIPDSESVDKAREYLEKEKEKVAKVRDDIYEALKQAQDK